MRHLVVRLGAIGDVVMALTMVTAIRHADPGAHISWMCGEIVRPLLACVPDIDELIVVDDRPILAGTSIARVAAVLGAMRKVAGRRYDKVYTPYRDSRYRLLTLTALKGEYRSLGDFGGRPLPLPGRYHGAEYARLVSGIDGAAVPLPAFPAVRGELSSELKASLRHGVRRVLLCPGGARNPGADDSQRRWPAASYSQLARELLREGHQVILGGAQSDAWVRPDFDGLDVTDLIGKTGLVDLLGLVTEADLVISHDSSAIHLASLVGTRLISLFGPTIPDEKVVEGPHRIVFWGGADLACRPCYDGKNYLSCLDNQCMKRISVAAVAAAARGLLSPL